MSDEFKRKLEAYEQGELSEAELEAFEKELEKLEEYQEYLQERDIPINRIKTKTMNDKRQPKIKRRGKWKSRFRTALTLGSFFILFTIVAGVFTGMYYSWGKPDRLQVFSNVIDHTLTITNPYGYLGGTSTNTKAYFGLEATRDLNKMVGQDQLEVGEMKVDFLFSLMAVPEEQTYGRVSQDRPAFTFPGAGNRNMSDWDHLNELPEGTVASAYVSFSDLLETREVFDLFEGKNMDLLWLAVDTGVETKGFAEGIIFEPVGFPGYPIWHDDDFVVTERHEEEGGWFGGKVISEGAESPEYETGDQNMLHKQFIKTLEFLEKHERKANRLVFGRLQLADQIDYLNDNGIHHYGAVITGPTKEILKLEEEELVAELEVDEVAFWNWTERQEE
ncbi:anti-sigma factor [Bacillus sp. AK031]